MLTTRQRSPLFPRRNHTCLYCWLCAIIKEAASSDALHRAGGRKSIGGIKLTRGLQITPKGRNWQDLRALKAKQQSPSNRLWGLWKDTSEESQHTSPEGKTCHNFKYVLQKKKSMSTVFMRSKWRVLNKESPNLSSPHFDPSLCYMTVTSVTDSRELSVDEKRAGSQTLCTRQA